MEPTNGADSTATQTKPASPNAKPGKSLIMVGVPTEEIRQRINTAAAQRNVSAGRYLLELVAKEFDIRLPEPAKRVSSLKVQFEALTPRSGFATEQEYDAAFEAFKTASRKRATEERGQRVKSALEMMEQLQKLVASGADTVDVKALLAQLQTVQG